MAVGTEAEKARKGAGAGVARGQCSKLGGNFGFVLSRRQVYGCAGAQIGRHVRDQIVEAVRADRVEHRADVALGMGKESHWLNAFSVVISRLFRY